MMGTLVRVVALDGSVWFVEPEMAPRYAMLSKAILPTDARLLDAAKAYWRDRKAC